MLIWGLVSKRINGDIYTGYLISGRSILYFVEPMEKGYRVMPYCYKPESIVIDNVSMFAENLEDAIEIIGRTGGVRTVEVKEGKLIITKRTGILPHYLPVFSIDNLMSKDAVLSELQQWYLCEIGSYHYTARCTEDGVFYDKLVRRDVIDHLRDKYYNITYDRKNYVIQNKALKIPYEGMPSPKVFGILPYVDKSSEKEESVNWVEHIKEKIKTHTKLVSSSYFTTFYSNFIINGNAVLEVDRNMMRVGSYSYNLMKLEDKHNLRSLFELLPLKSLYHMYGILTKDDFVKYCTMYMDCELNSGNMCCEPYISVYTAIMQYIEFVNTMVSNLRKSGLYLIQPKYVSILFDRKPYQICDSSCFYDLYTYNLKYLQRQYKLLDDCNVAPKCDYEGYLDVNIKMYHSEVRAYMYDDVDFTDYMEKIFVEFPRFPLIDGTAYVENFYTILALLDKRINWELNKEEQKRLNIIQEYFGIDNDDLVSYAEIKTPIRVRVYNWYKDEVVNRIKVGATDGIFTISNVEKTFEEYVERVFELLKVMPYYKKGEIKTGVLQHRNNRALSMSKLIPLLYAEDNRVTVIGRKLAEYVEKQCVTYTEVVMETVIGEKAYDEAVMKYPSGLLFVIAQYLRYTLCNEAQEYRGKDVRGLERLANDKYRVDSPIPLREIPAQLEESIKQISKIADGKLQGIDISTMLKPLIDTYCEENNIVLG